MQGKFHFEALITVKILQTDMKLQPWLSFFTMSNIFNTIKKNKEMKFNRRANEVTADLKDREKIRKGIEGC